MLYKVLLFNYLRAAQKEGMIILLYYGLLYYK